MQVRLHVHRLHPSIEPLGGEQLHDVLSEAAPAAVLAGSEGLDQVLKRRWARRTTGSGTGQKRRFCQKRLQARERGRPGGRAGGQEFHRSV